MCPNSHWGGQFQVTKVKIIESIAKLNSADIKPHLKHLHFNTRLMKKMFVGRGTIELKYQQNRVLRKLHETIIAKKLRLGRNFLRAVLH